LAITLLQQSSNSNSNSHGPRQCLWCCHRSSVLPLQEFTWFIWRVLHKRLGPRQSAWAASYQELGKLEIENYGITESCGWLYGTCLCICVVND